MRLFLIRHGQTPSNVIGALDTLVPGPGLTELGHQQATLVGAALAAEPIDAVFASSQLRAQLTAQPLATHRGVELQVRDGLREITAGELEMLTDRSAVMEYVETCIAWATGDLALRMRGGESGHEVFGRFNTVLDEIAETGHENVAVVSHGAMLRAWLGHTVGDVGGRISTTAPLPNTGVIVVNGSQSGWNVESWLGEAFVELIPGGVDPLASALAQPNRND